MDVEYLIVADAAQVQNGKMFILGGGLSIWQSGVYPTQALLRIAVSILVDSSEAGAGKRYPISITISDEAGIPIIPTVNAQFEIGISPQAPKGAKQRVPFALNAGVPIPRPGRYTVIASAGSAPKKQVPFDAIFVGQKVESHLKVQLNAATSWRKCKWQMELNTNRATKSGDREFIEFGTTDTIPSTK